MAHPRPNSHEHDSPEGGWTFFDLLLIMCAFGPGMGAMGFAKSGHCGWKGALLALVIGVILGSVFAVLTYKGTGLLGGIIPGKGGWWLIVPIVLTYFCWFGVACWAGELAEQSFFPKQNAYLKACGTTRTCQSPQATHDLENMH